MAQSYLSSVPFAAPDSVPWGWNPAATFLTAYKTMQENQLAQQQEQRAQREFEIAQELKQYLLPLEKQKAQLSLEKMNLEMEKTKGELTRQTLFTRMATDAYRNTNRGVNSAVAGNGGSSNQAPARASNPYGFGLGNIAAPKTQQPPTQKKVSWKVVAPAQPQGTQGP